MRDRMRSIISTSCVNDALPLARTLANTPSTPPLTTPYTQPNWHASSTSLDLYGPERCEGTEGGAIRPGPPQHLIAHAPVPHS